MSQGFLNSTTHNIAWFVKRHRADELVLRAPFQRNPVWTDKQKAYLIDTILHGFPIPELYMQESVDPNGDERYTVVDGQQRLRAFIEYIDGKFALDPVDSPQFANKKFSDLTEDQRKAIYNYNFIVRTLPDMPDADLRAMFRRLNRNVVALNSQELRHATYWGEFIQTMERIADAPQWPTMNIFSQNDIRRMLDIEFVSEIAIAYLHGHQNKKEQLDDWYQAYERNFERKEEVANIFEKTLSELLLVLPNISLTRWRKKSDFYSLFLAFSAYAPFFPLDARYRSAIRLALQDLELQIEVFWTDPASEGIYEFAATYASAVERAASDLANRKERYRVLHDLIDRAATTYALSDVGKTQLDLLNDL